MNAPNPVRLVASADVSQAPRTVYVRVEHIAALADVLANAFDLLGLRQLALTCLNVVLDKVAPVEGRTVAQVALDLTTCATDTDAVGIKGLLAAALALNPQNPELLQLAAEWRDLVFHAVRHVPIRAWRHSRRARATCTLAAPATFRRRCNSSVCTRSWPSSAHPAAVNRRWCLRESCRRCIGFHFSAAIP